MITNNKCDLIYPSNRWQWGLYTESEGLCPSQHIKEIQYIMNFWSTKKKYIDPGYQSCIIRYIEYSLTIYSI